jgi:ribosomal protein S18 acetylase RimI-like enzyme
VSWTIRPATVDDVRDLVILRRAMFEAMGHTDSDALDRMCDASAEYFERDLPSGAFRAWVAEENGRPIASIGLVVHRVPPSPGRPVGKEAYVMNLVTLPDYRRRGIGSALLDCVLAVVRSEGIPMASLHATQTGRRIYERAGFRIDERSPEMRARLS